MRADYSAYSMAGLTVDSKADSMAAMRACSMAVSKAGTMAGLKAVQSEKTRAGSWVGSWVYWRADQMAWQRVVRMVERKV